MVRKMFREMVSQRGLFVVGRLRLVGKEVVVFARPLSQQRIYSRGIG